MRWPSQDRHRALTSDHRDGPAAQGRCTTGVRESPRRHRLSRCPDSNADAAESAVGLPSSGLGNTFVPNQNLGPNHGIGPYAGFEAAPPPSNGGVPRSAPACRFWRVPTDDRYRTCVLLRRSQRSNRLSRSGSVLPTMPPDDDNPIGMMISQAYRLLVARSARMLRDYGLSVPQMECLWALHDQPGISNAELAALLRVTPQAVSIAQRSLVDQGLITRSQTAPTAGCGRHSRPNEESGSSKRPTPHCGPTTKGSSPRCPQGIRPRCSAY